MAYTTTKAIDGDALRAWLKAYCKENEMTRAEVGAMIGRSPGYLSLCAHNGRMSVTGYNHFISTFNLPSDAFSKKPKAAAPDITIAPPNWWDFNDHPKRREGSFHVFQP